MTFIINIMIMRRIKMLVTDTYRATILVKNR